MDKQIKDEMDYQLLHALMNNFLNKGLLTKEEFEQIKQELLLRYKPYNPDWGFMEVYADLGISGTSTKNRQEFNRMIPLIRVEKT